MRKTAGFLTWAAGVLFGGWGLLGLVSLVLMLLQPSYARPTLAYGPDFWIWLVLKLLMCVGGFYAARWGWRTMRGLQRT